MHYSSEREEEIVGNIVAGRKWHDNGITPAKDSKMAMTQENFYRVITMRDEIIFEQKEEIAKLKSAINRLRQKLI
jgi:hypothetical protein